MAGFSGKRSHPMISSGDGSFKNRLVLPFDAQDYQNTFVSGWVSRILIHGHRSMISTYLRVDTF